MVLLGLWRLVRPSGRAVGVVRLLPVPRVRHLLASHGKVAVGLDGRRGRRPHVTPDLDAAQPGAVAGVRSALPGPPVQVQGDDLALLVAGELVAAVHCVEKERVCASRDINMRE